ncbi:GNAT family N-acetyltransferase [Sphingomonas sp. So64.6b]|uniref:GNAT family N-acetyltransferase n=1 Tax=Sphingomonas sp. So64.6b TaxID=2997354 RepID=UPI0015FF9BFC|nr:GNAT family N-acetyltransferase [Sphingomonas sp. So64.6b]QNA82717.1 GNAT family N-acetyltransferase [Sphingomonas sp. So64.6b]
MTNNLHPLDRPVWNSLTTRQAHLALGDTRALRYAPAINLFGAAADNSPANLFALACLLPPGGTLGLVEAGDVALPPDSAIRSRATINQMVLTELNAPGSQIGGDPIDFVALSDDDAPEMLALATLTAPGPFFAQTNRLGDFIGVKQDGRLVAMAGERMKPTGFTEVSAVCTHPDHRGHGYARVLMQIVIERILARNETAFLHVYPGNGAIPLYEALGFSLRAAMTYTVLERS